MSIWKERIHVFFQYKDLLFQLVSRDIKLKYRRSFLGYVWSILNPLLIMIVLTLVFSAMFSRDITNYPIYLLTGRTIYSFFTDSTNAGMRSILGNSALIKKCYVPKYIFTLAKVTSSMVDFVFSLGALLIVMIFTRTPFSVYILFFPVLLLQLFLFCCGVGFFLAQLNVFFRDAQYIYNALTTALMYATPLFYPIEQLDNNPSVQYFITHFNPLYYYVKQFRDIVYTRCLPDPGMVGIGFAIAIGVFIVGLAMFKKNQDRFILYI
ncbi:MAG: ABC transporter permease [Candidatus Limivivens sp.]|nr:ABC transporter permease [Candidatus Limivivens sp.]